MIATTGKVNLLGLTQPQLESFFESIGEKRFRAGQVMKWIHHFGVDDFDAMSNLGKALRESSRPAPRFAARRSSAKTSPATAPANGWCGSHRVAVWKRCTSPGRPWNALRFLAGRLCAGLQLLFHRQTGFQQQSHGGRGDRSGVDCQQVFRHRPGEDRSRHHQCGDDGDGRAVAEFRQRCRCHADHDGRPRLWHFQAQGDPVDLRRRADDRRAGQGHRRVPGAVAACANDALRDQLVPINKKYP